MQDIFNGWNERELSAQIALRFAMQALETDPTLAEAQEILAEVYLVLREYDKALAQYDKALDLGINNAETLILVGWGYSTLGKPKAALELAQKAMRMSPFPPAWYWGGLASAFAANGRYAEAVPIWKRCADEIPDFLWCQAGLTVAYVETGQIDEARIGAQELIRVNPKVTAENNEFSGQISDPSYRSSVIDALRKAGLP